MPADDDRLQDALRSTAREPSIDGVVERVHAKRARRRAVQRLERGAIVAALFVGLVTVGVVALDERAGDDQQIAVAPDPRTYPSLRVIDGADARDVHVRRLRLDPDEGYVRGPVILSGSGALALAAYDRSGESYTFPPSRVVRVELDGRVVEVDGLQGEILSLAEGEGARWALTHDQTVIGPEDPEFRVKRIGPNGEVVSNAVPPGEQPVGNITAGGGGVWVPVSDGVLRFDPVTGAFATKTALANASERRAVAVGGKFVFVTDANTLVRLDPASAAPGGIVGEVPPGIELVDAASSSDLAFVLGFDAASDSWIASDADRVLTFHPSFIAESIHAAGDLVWVDGTVDGVTTLVVLDTDGTEIEIARTIRVAKAADSDVVLVSEREAIVAVRGSLFRGRLPT